MTISTADARAQILAAVRRHRPDACGLPHLPDAPTTDRAPQAQFVDTLNSVGGEYREVVERARIVDALEGELRQRGAETVCSLLDAMPRFDLPVVQFPDPSKWPRLDVAIFPAHLGVAENAAVWIGHAHPFLRPLAFLCEHCFVVLPVSGLVTNMHEAYQRLQSAWNDPTGMGTLEYGVFVSGPSKTADIEQALVTGAQGPRSLTVFLCSSD
ncbi:MAG TPA: LUD domain-containing protein [Pirellulaceae bacterium]